MTRHYPPELIDSGRATPERRVELATELHATPDESDRRKISDNWPDVVPVSRKEIDVLLTWLGPVLREISR